MRTLVLSLIASTPLAALAEDKTTAPPEWLAGYWLACDDGAQTVEAWISDGSGTLVGVNQSAGAFEHLRIGASAAGITYFARPGGGALTEFAMTGHKAAQATFENTSLDFPQRVIYERRGDTLNARIEGVVEGKAQSVAWVFRSAPMGSACK